MTAWPLRWIMRRLLRRMTDRIDAKIALRRDLALAAMLQEGAGNVH